MSRHVAIVVHVIDVAAVVAVEDVVIVVTTVAFYKKAEWSHRLIHHLLLPERSEVHFRISFPKFISEFHSQRSLPPTIQYFWGYLSLAAQF